MAQLNGAAVHGSKGRKGQVGGSEAPRNTTLASGETETIPGL